MLQGSIVALVTPFKNNDIDYNAVDRLLDFHLESKTDGILLSGTTGESPTLAGDEKEYFVRYVIQKLAGKIPVMVGTGTNNLSKTIAETLKAQQLGADYALVITPYYNKPTQKGMYYFFKKVYEETDIPLVIYNVPGRTSINITAETVIRLAEDCERIVAIKEASGNIAQITKIIKYAPKDFSLLSGEDMLNLPIMCCGGKGTVSVTANIVPSLMSKLINLCLKGDYEKAKAIHLDLLELNQVLFIETNPIPVKEALHLMGYIEREIRLPLYFLESENLQKVEEVLKKLELIK
ncbi:MAG: 4-hydroxy-tetrahydrodipicolinate synthase [Candidatus Cloacimonetes bacterium]|nr:4-hydroxy-tetrahydrodipicolinate synthase [Candidatus Cloacimonadota bacterium]